MNHHIRDPEDYKHHHSYIGEDPVTAGLNERPELVAWSTASLGMEWESPPPGLKSLRENLVFPNQSMESGPGRSR
jgi:hypothetical protein